MDDAEQLLEKLAAQMTPAQRATFDKAAKMSARVPVQTFAAKRIEAPAPQPAQTPAILKGRLGSAPDANKAKNEQILAQAYRTAFGGRVPMEVLHAALGDSIPRGVIVALT
jgi:hypothetical protein